MSASCENSAAALYVVLLLCIGAISCGADEKSSTPDDSDVGVMRDTQWQPRESEDGEDSGDGEPDQAEDPSLMDQERTNGDQATTDLDPELPGPDNLSIGCLVDSDCPDEGDDPGVCCSEALFYRSYCSTLSVCGPGGRDACLTDEQCGMRNSSRPHCCHDPGWYHYCAPSIETCLPLEPCEHHTDCFNENRICCSIHEYYQIGMCIDEWRALYPERDCP